MNEEYYEDMLEQIAINKYLNMIANDYNGQLAKIFEEKYINKDKEIERLNKENTILRQNSQYLVKQKDELEEVINKAIEYIEQHNDYFLLKREVKELLSILKGDKKE